MALDEIKAKARELNSRVIFSCPHCRKETDYLNKDVKIENKFKRKKAYLVHRIFDNSTNKFIVKNMFRMRIVDILFLISLIILLLGFAQINEQCYDFLKDPCTFAGKTNQCIVQKINLTTFNSYAIQDIKIPT